nr:immunoglobulin light chain junction region [Mus musculus]NSL99541.1 immunoglobulin light chain junction region [Mus musculus]NSM02756.1 immunoglobulin light chain junction region [Mus musculus]
CQQSIEDPRTF